MGEKRSLSTDLNSTEPAPKIVKVIPLNLPAKRDLLGSQDEPVTKEEVEAAVDLNAPCTFPFSNKPYMLNKRRGWLSFPVLDARSARISCYTEHLKYKSSSELAIIIQSLVDGKKMDFLFLNANSFHFMQRDLNPKHLSMLTNAKLVTVLEALPPNTPLKAWYKGRYSVSNLSGFHHLDLLDILETYIDRPSKDQHEFDVEQATFELMKAASKVRRSLRT